MVVPTISILCFVEFTIQTLKIIPKINSRFCKSMKVLKKFTFALGCIETLLNKNSQLKMKKNPVTLQLDLIDLFYYKYAEKILPFLIEVHTSLHSF